MIIDLVDYDRRLQFPKETKALAIKLSHKKNSEKRFARDSYAIVISCIRKGTL